MRNPFALLMVLLGLCEAAQAQRVAAGFDQTLVLHPDGKLWASGGNTYGDLGGGSAQVQVQPVPVGSATWRRVAAGS